MASDKRLHITHDDADDLVQCGVKLSTCCK